MHSQHISWSGCLRQPVLLAARNLLPVVCLLAAVAGCGGSQNPADSAATTASGRDTGTGRATDGGASSTNAATSGTQPPAAELNPVVVIRTPQGELFVRLDANKAPHTVANFLNYASSGHYQQTIFHHVEPGYAILGGGFTADLKEKPARYAIQNEAANGLKNRRGTLAMFRSPDDPHSATCQFLINLVDNPSLDHQGNSPQEFGYCVFGEVVEGLDVLDRIATVETESRQGFDKLPREPVVIQGLRRELR